MACNVLLDGMDELPDLALRSVAAKDELIILEKAVDHSEHGDHNGKTMTCNVLMIHPLSEPLLSSR